MATLGKGTLLMNSSELSYSFIPSDYTVADFVSIGPNMWQTVGDQRSDAHYYICQIYASQAGANAYNITFGNDTSHSFTANLLNGSIDFDSNDEVSRTFAYSSTMMMDRRNSTDNLTVGNLFVEILKAFESVNPSITLNTITDTYGNKIDYLNYAQTPGAVVTSSHLVFKDNQFDVEIEDTYTNPSGKYIFPTVASVYSCEITTDVLKTRFNISTGQGGQILNVQNVPEKPTWSGPYTDSAGKYWTINTNSRRKGNIYFNGSPEPLQSWTDDTTGPWSYKFYPQQVGAYTANTISTVNLGGTRDIYSELSETLIVENEVVDIQISFNEYTGTITATAPEGSYSVYKLMKKAGEGYGQVGENTTGIFQITESGTYRVECDAKPLFVVNPSQPITVETTLDTPNAYVEFSNPSQLGFDEVENANVYDIYRVNDDGEEDELVESVTVGVTARARSVRRAEKIFRVVVEDDGYSL